MTFNFLTTPRIFCQSGGLGQPGVSAQNQSITRAVAITDIGIVGSGFDAEAVAVLAVAGVAARVFEKIQADLPNSQIGRNRRRVWKDN